MTGCVVASDFLAYLCAVMKQSLHSRLLTVGKRRWGGVCAFKQRTNSYTYNNNMIITRRTCGIARGKFASKNCPPYHFYGSTETINSQLSLFHF